MSRAPRISVLLPVRDGQTYLDECLHSVCRQTLVDFELLVVDDGSRDATPARVAAWAARDPRIRLLRRPGDGIVAALNHGLGEARGALVARMDADDRMHPQRLEAQAALLEARPDLALVACRVRAFAAFDLGAGTREYLRWQNGCLSEAAIRDQRFVECPFTHPSVTFRRDEVWALGGYRPGPFPEDYELWLRMADRGLAMAKLDRVLLDWRQHENSLSRRDPRYAREAFDALRARYLGREPRLDPGRPLVVWGAGRRTRRRVRWLEREGLRPVAWIDIDPRKLGNRVQGRPVHPPTWLAGQPAPRPFVLGYVASHGARDRIARALEDMRYREGADYLMVG